MATYTIRPNGTVLDGGGLAPSSLPATVVSYLADTTDANAVYPTSYGVEWAFDLTNPTIPSDEFVARVGSFIRFKDGGTYYGYPMSCGVKAYRVADGIPSSTFDVPSTGSSTYVTTEAGRQNVSWSLSDIATLRLLWSVEKSAITAPAITTTEVGATIYTIKQATATSANLSSTTSKPTFAVNTAVTIGFETSEGVSSNLKKVVTQVWVESGGTAPGTGTFVTSKEVTSYVQATGTVALNITSDVAIANGTYKFYTRATRFRDDGTSASDTIGAWSAAYTLTQSVPLPTTPTVSRTSDQVNDRVSITVTPVATTNYTTPVTIDVERSDDGGTTWTGVRGVDDATGAFGTTSNFYDYEAPRGVTVYYRARVNAYYTPSGLINTSAWTANQSASITATGWNLKVPVTPALNDLNVNVVGDPTEEVSEDMGVFRPMDRRYPVVVSGTLSGWDGDLRLQTTSDAEWTALKAILECQQVLLLESPFGWSKYIRLLSGSKSSLKGTATAPVRDITVGYVQTSAP